MASFKLSRSETEVSRELAVRPKEVDWRTLARCSTASARALLPLEVAERCGVLPLGVHGEGVNRCLSLLCGEMPGAQALKELQFVAGVELLFERVSVQELNRAIIAAYRGQAAEPSASVPLLLEGLLHRAIYLDASDIHLAAEEAGMRVRFRVDGALREDTSFSITAAAARELLRRIAVLCRIGNTAPYRPQEGAFSFECGGRRVRVRVSIVQQVRGAKAVLRVLASDGASGSGGESFGALGLEAEQVMVVKGALGSSQGVILSAGPTGSGKSTLLYRALEWINDGTRNIVTIEDPVERMIPGITQIEVASAEGQSFIELLPVLLRQDPDVILVGEIRESVSGATALNAGITGHLVLSTVHAQGALEALRRLIFMGVQSDLVAAALRLVIGQRLLPRNCIHCLTRRAPNATLARLFRIPTDRQIGISVGCQACERSGFAGRIGVYELLRISASMQQALVEEARVNTAQFDSLAVAEGFVPYAAQVRARLLEGVISPRSALLCLGVGPEVVGY